MGSNNPWDDCLRQLAQTALKQGKSFDGGAVAGDLGQDAADLLGQDAIFTLQTGKGSGFKIS